MAGAVDAVDVVVVGDAGGVVPAHEPAAAQLEPAPEDVPAAELW